MSKTHAATGRRLTVTEVLDLRFLPDEGLHFDEPLEAAWLDAQLQGIGSGQAPFRAVEGTAGTATLDVEPLAPVASRPPIRVHGAVKASIETTCVRCLEPVRQALDADVDLTLFARGHAPDRAAGPEDDEGLTEDALDEGTYDKNEIDLPSLVREALILEIAMNPACADEDACTARTNAMLEAANRAAVDATQSALDERWAPLRRLVDPAKPGKN